MMSQVSLASVSSTTTTSSTLTAVPSYGTIDFSLADVCSYIDAHRSLQTAEIISCECYSERAGIVMHRFLLMQLWRRGKKDIWLRLDRRMAKNTSLRRFLAAAGTTSTLDKHNSTLLDNIETMLTQIFCIILTAVMVAYLAVP